MPTYEREEARVPSVELQPATVRLYEALEAMSASHGLVANFAWCLGILADAPDFQEQFGGMVDFMRMFTRYGLEVAAEELRDAEGIPIILAADGVGMHEGRIIGLLSAYEDNIGHFAAVARGDIDGTGDKTMSVDLNLDEPGIAIITEIQP